MKTPTMLEVFSGPIPLYQQIEWLAPDTIQKQFPGALEKAGETFPNFELNYYLHQGKLGAVSDQDEGPEAVWDGNAWVEY